MLTRPSSAPDDPRRGVALLIVVSLLALFAVIGLAFLLYAESEASASRIYREAQTPNQVADIPAALLLQEALKQLIYDTSDDATTPGGVYSALRGHSLARNMYGWNYVLTTDPVTKQGTLVANDYTPFNGLGRIHSNNGAGLTTVLPSDGTMPADEYNLVNYIFFRNDKWIRDPERYNLSQPFDPLKFRQSPAVALDPAQQVYFGGFNPPYSFPDANFMALAAISMGDGQNSNKPVTSTGTLGTAIPTGSILTQSFHRRSLFGDLYDANNPNHFTNPNWTNQAGKYLTLRPRPIDNTPAFPYPVSPGGDVQNLLGGPGYYDPNTGATYAEDSVWIDLGYPAQQTRNGQWFKPLFAFLILDLDNRVNLNVHGNIRISPTTSGGPSAHASQFGIGKHEVNLGTVLDQPSGTTVPEWQNLLGGNPSNSLAHGRYGKWTGMSPASPGPAYATTPQALMLPSYSNYSWTYNALPLLSLLNYGTNMPATSPPKYSNAPLYSLVNHDAAIGTSSGSGTTWTAAQKPFTFPSTGRYDLFPSFPPTEGYWNGDPNPAASTGVIEDDRLAHPLLNNPLSTRFGNTVFARDDMRYLIGRFNQFQNPEFQQAASLINLIPNNLNDNVTQPGTNLEFFPATQPVRRIRNLITTTSFDVDRPGVTPWWYVDPSNPYALSSASDFPSSSAIQFSISAITGAQTSEFIANDYRAASAQKFDRVDLARRLVPYPAPDPNTHLINLATDGAQFQAAQVSRVTMARDIFFRLIYSTGANQKASKGTDEYNALRWLAQVAVNMVDYIDEDDYSTPFDWNNQLSIYLLLNGKLPDDQIEYVYGTERPRLVINEAYSEIQDDPSDPMIAIPGPTQKMSPNRKYKCAFWVELYNPLSNDTNGLANSASGAAVLQVTSGMTTTPVYQLLVATSDLAYMKDFKNATGDTDPAKPANVKLQVRDWTGIPGSAIQTQTSNSTPTGPNYCIMAPDRADLTTPGSKIDFQNTPLMQGYMENDSQLSQSQPQATFFKVTDKVTPPPDAKAKQALVYDVDPGDSMWVNTHDILLQRLACPAIPFNPPPLPAGSPPPLPGQPTYNANLPVNPFITVDYVSSLQTVSAIQATPTGPNNGPNPPFGTYVGLSARASVGRTHPYIASTPGAQAFDPPGYTPPGPQPPNTFGKKNSNLANTSDTLAWLVHLDRKPISVPEMLNVSAYRPHLLTQKFNTTSMTASVSPHTLPWQDQTTRIYRMLEFLTVRDRTVEMAAGGRVPGKINLNTVWDHKIIDALTDPNGANFFPTTVAGYGTGGPDATTGTHPLYNTLLAARSPSGRINGMTAGVPNNDQPFLSFAAPFINSGSDPQWGTAAGWNNSDVNMTLDRTIGTTASRLFDVSNPIPPPPSGATHKEEWLKQELFTKVSNSITNRSNVFAVYLTVGFFEVVPEFDSAGKQLFPDKLGEEIGSTARTGGPNKVLRHRMFALVDRTNLSIDPKNTAANTPAPGAPFYYPAQTLQAQDPTQLLTAPGQDRNKPFTPYDNPLIDLEIPRPSSQAGPYTPPVPGTQPGTYTAWIPATGLSGGALQGSYDGFPWSIQPRDSLVLGNGDARQIVTVAAVGFEGNYSQMGQVSFFIPDPNPSKDQNGNPRPFLPLGAGFMISNVIPGNPGPQSAFDYTTNLYRPVVPVTAILQ